MQRNRGWAVPCMVALALGSACDDSDGGGVGSSCQAAQQCFLGIASDVEGDPVCLDRVQGGYCTHECDEDEDCCTVQGECPNRKEQVCAPFESAGQRLCFLSCEGEADGDAFCELWAHQGFHCRSTGGGARNRKVCVP
jgi:hypothetical protein